MSFIIPGESEQIALIEHMEAESVPATPFAFSVSQEDMDDILRTGGNTANHRLILAAEFSKGKPVEEMTQILRQVYHGGNGMVTEHAAGILHNRRACSALQGIGGRATNKQSAKSPTIALLARITECSILG